MKITFFGATEEVTGSRYFVEHEKTKILVDCGLFQGNEQDSQCNREKFPINPESIDAVILTHAHIDHSGYLPLLVKKGFKGKIYCSKPTYELCKILLIDSGKIHEEDAKRADKNKDSGTPAEPLYTVDDAENSLSFFKVVDYNKVLNLSDPLLSESPSSRSLRATLTPCHHIPGASFATISDGKTTLTFSGDLGRPHQLIMKAPSRLTQTDFLVLDSTYGDRIHATGNPIDILGKLINKAIERGGTVLIPAFAVARTQTILYCLYQLKEKKIIPDVPIFLDSPMAISVTKLFCNFKDEIKLPPNSCKNIFNVATFTPKAEQSKRLDRPNAPAIIIAGSGMVDGGRMLYHLRYFISDPKNTVIFVGFQAEETNGHDLVNGAKKINLFGKSYAVHAQIAKTDIFSTHADYNEILEWLSYFKNAPKKVFLTHGELQSAQSLKKKIEERFSWSVVIPKYSDSFDLD